MVLRGPNALHVRSEPRTRFYFAPFALYAHLKTVAYAVDNNDRLCTVRASPPWRYWLGGVYFSTDIIAPSYEPLPSAIPNCTWTTRVYFRAIRCEWRNIIISNNALLVHYRKQQLHAVYLRARRTYQLFTNNNIIITHGHKSFSRLSSSS